MALRTMQSQDDLEQVPVQTDNRPWVDFMKLRNMQICPFYLAVAILNEKIVIVTVFRQAVRYIIKLSPS